VSSFKILSKSTLFLQYSDFLILKMAFIRQLGFLNFQILGAHQDGRANMHYYTKFRPSNGCRHMHLTFFLKWWLSAILDYLKLIILNIA